MRLIIDIEDGQVDNIRQGAIALLGASGTVTNATVVGVAEPVCVAGTGHTMRAVFDITPLSEVRH